MLNYVYKLVPFKLRLQPVEFSNRINWYNENFRRHILFEWSNKLKSSTDKHVLLNDWYMYITALHSTLGIIYYRVLLCQCWLRYLFNLYYFRNEHVDNITIRIDELQWTGSFRVLSLIWEGRSCTWHLLAILLV